MKELNATWAPEVLFRCTGTSSHMANAELWLWYLDVVVREMLRQKRAQLLAQRSPHADKTAVLLVDPASVHFAVANGLEIRPSLSRPSVVLTSLCLCVLLNSAW
jgi:hypothetical protein